MTEIKLSFSPLMAQRSLINYKVLTTRLSPKGAPGDTFTLSQNGLTRKFRILEIAHLPLFLIAERLFMLEGFETTGDFIDYWDQLPGYPKYKEAYRSYFPAHFFTSIQ